MTPSASPLPAMHHFQKALAERSADPAGRRWVFVPYDQLSDAIGPLARHAPEAMGIVVVENPQKPARRPYHKQKLALVLANMRHFALEQAARGVAVRHLVAPEGYAPALIALARELGPIEVMRPAERELRRELAPAFDARALVEIPHEGWLTTPEDFALSAPKGPPWRMDAFYRQVRKRTGILMERGKPVGGKYSFDADNREAWRGTPPAPTLPEFAPDSVTQEVLDLVAKHFAHHPGELVPEQLPATREDARKMWAWARQEALQHFGPYEDAMSQRERTLFHTRISALVNLHRLTPAEIIADTLAMDLPLSSKEGFVRQVLGWREFVRHVHEATDGFRTMAPEASSAGPGDGGWSRWRGEPWPAQGGGDAGACPSATGADRGVPPAYWGARSGLNCLDTVVESVWQEGYSHHITRLMVLGNIATLLDVSPRELTDWFWVAYTDAFDWVVEPNVLGMATFGAGEVMTTKPYVSGAGYISRMSDYCRQCAFDPKTSCPLTPMYWAWLGRHAEALADNPRMFLPLQALRKRSEAQRKADAEVFESVSQSLANGHNAAPSRLF